MIIRVYNRHCTRTHMHTTCTKFRIRHLLVGRHLPQTPLKYIHRSAQYIYHNYNDDNLSLVDATSKEGGLAIAPWEWLVPRATEWVEGEVLRKRIENEWNV